MMSRVLWVRKSFGIFEQLQVRKAVSKIKKRGASEVECLHVPTVGIVHTEVSPLCKEKIF